MPPDPTNLEDMVHAALFSGDPATALSHAALLDPWLAAHMADLMQALSLIEKETNEEFVKVILLRDDNAYSIRSSGLNIRDFYVLNYAQYLHADSTLWRITVAYMFSCGESGIRSADEVLMHVPLRLRSVESIAQNGEKNGTASFKSGDLAGVVKEINATCYEYQREEVRRTICRVCIISRLGLFVFNVFATDSCSDLRTRKGIRTRAFVCLIGGRLARPGPRG